MSFRAPIGSDEERNSCIIWPGKWIDVTPYLTHYEHGYHTGADLNLNSPHWDGDAHSSVRAIGNGIVTYAQLYSLRVWGKIIIIDHGIVDGRPLFSRYAHVEQINVSAGQSVNTGDQIARVGNGEGLFFYHLHFDISTTDLLRTVPNHWPKEDSQLLKQHYVDPRAWLGNHVFQDNIIPDNSITENEIKDNMIDTPTAQAWFVIATLGLNVRTDHDTSARKVGKLDYRSRVSIEIETVNQDTYTWGRINGGIYNGNWVAIGKSDQSDSFISSNPPDN